MGIGVWIQTFLLAMEFPLSEPDKGWDPVVLSRYGAIKNSFTKEGEGSRVQTKNRRQASEVVCKTLFNLWNDFEFAVLLCCAKKRHGYSYYIQWYFLEFEHTSLDALVRPTHYLCFAESVRDRHIYGRF
jgi:hypothetical protein